MAKKSLKSRTKTGTLRIGDQWNAINIIAHSQTHPLKAVCELAENAIDAACSHIQIVRRRSKGQLYLDLIDDGSGVLPDFDGVPDFGRIATHVCDSMKRQLDAGERVGVHGEYGIGLLSFWSLGERFRMICEGSDGRQYELLLERGKRTYTVSLVRGSLAMGGTRVIVGPLLESTRKVVTGEKLARYLSSELRDRIRSSNVEIRIVDRVSRKETLVEPRQFEGDRVEVPDAVRTAFGDIAVELYFRDAASQGESGVAICKDGTRVLRDITELIHFQHSPWSESRIEGILDFGAFNLAPGTRGGIVPDERLHAFTEAAKTLESTLANALEQREQAESDKASRDILKQVHRAFRNALRELPSEEYVFFDIPEAKHSLRGSSASKHGGGKSADARAISSSAADPSSVEPGLEQGLLPISPGALGSVRIATRHPRRSPGEECRLRAVARDEHGLTIEEGVAYFWSVAIGESIAIHAENDAASVRAEIVGQVTVEVSAAKDGRTVTDQVVVKFVEDAEQMDDDGGKGLPSYRLEPEHGQPWRSRYEAKKNEIIINSAHRDFLANRTTGAKHRRYIGKLYAKEVVLINFPHESPAQVMERLIQITLRTEAVL
jgi:hypothetical protein